MIKGAGPLPAEERTLQEGPRLLFWSSSKSDRIPYDQLYRKPFLQLDTCLPSYESGQLAYCGGCFLGNILPDRGERR